MENQAKTTPIIFCVQRAGYMGSTPIITWTSTFSQSVPIRHLTRLPLKNLEKNQETWETLTSIILLDQFSSQSPFLGLQPCTMTLRDFLSLRFLCFTTSDDLDLVDSADIYLDPNGGTASKTSSKANRIDPYFDYAIHCCVRPALRCLVNDLPVEILEYIFSSLEANDYYDSSYYHLSEVIPLVCRLWNKVYFPFEEEPTTSSVQLARLKQFPGKRFLWDRFSYSPKSQVEFHEYIHTVTQFQPLLRRIHLDRPLQHFPLDDLLLLAKVRTLKDVFFKGLTTQEVWCFLQVGQHLRLNTLQIDGMTEGRQDWTAINSSNVESQFQFQLIKVDELSICVFDDSIHKVLNCLQKDHLQNLFLRNDIDTTIKPLKDPIQLSGYRNLVDLHLQPINTKNNNLVPFHFISTICTASNFPKLRYLRLRHCYIDPTELPHLLDMPALQDIHIVLFEHQKTYYNLPIRYQVMKKFMKRRKSTQCYICYFDCP